MSEPKQDPFSKARKTAESAEAIPFLKTPPSSTEAEQGVLGCILLSAQDSIGECIEKIKPGSAAFYDVRNKAIYELLLEMNERREAIDVITVMQRLKDKNQLESVVGIAYLAELPDKVPSAANVGFYISIVLEKHILRRAIEHAQSTIVRAYESESLDEFLDGFESGTMAVRDSITTNKEFSTKEHVHARINFYEQCHSSGGGLIGISTGFHDIDKHTSGLQDKNYIIIAGRASSGKTAISMNIAENVAIDQKIPVGIFSLEMSAEALVGRMISSRSRTNERKITAGEANEQDFKKITLAAAAVSSAPIFIDDTAALPIDQLCAKARRMKANHGVGLIIIDYIQLVKFPKHAGNDVMEISNVSMAVKALAKELGIPIIALAQMNREIEKGQERRPRMSDLKGASQLEQDADLILMLQLSNPGEAAMNPSIVQVSALIAKQRNGIVGIDIPLTFFREFTRFESSSPIQPSDSQWKK